MVKEAVIKAVVANFFKTPYCFTIYKKAFTVLNNWL